MSGLAAHFFTGGIPEVHHVRDISPTGIYVLTTERWYLGTIVRLTLTDCRKPTIERSLTVNATVVRWGSDGVGLEFVVHNAKDRRQRQADGADDVDRMQINSFIQRLRSDG
jgi:hypothetical protein